MDPDAKCSAPSPPIPGSDTSKRTGGRFGFAGVRRRLPIYVLLFVLGLVGTGVALDRNPQTEVDALAQAVIQSARAQQFYRHRGASLGLYGRHGYSLTLYVGNSDRFSPARYLIVSRIDGLLSGELLKHQGSQGVSRLTGARLDAYLERCELDLSGIERAYAAWLTQAGGGKR